MLRPRRVLIRTLIAAFWLVMVGWLLYREVILPQSLTVSRAQTVFVPRDYWMGVFMGETERAGFINIRTRPEAQDGDPGAQIKLTARVQLNLFGYDADMAVTGHAWLAEDQHRAIFDYTLRAGESESRIHGALRDGKLTAVLSAAGVDTPFTFPVSEQMMLSTGLGSPAMDLPILAPGEEVYIDTFDPSTMSAGKARLVCTGREQLMVAGEMVDTSIIAITIGGMTTQAWVTDDQETVKAQTPIGFMLKKITPEEALSPIEADDRASLVEQMMVRPTGVPLKRGVATMRARISGVPAELPLPSDNLQQVQSDQEVLIAVPLDPRNVAPERLSDDERMLALASDPLVNAENAEIQTAAKEAIAHTADEWGKALALYEWTYTNLRKVPTLSVPTAVDVLRTRQGDCNEHTVLYCAMARAVGLPARIAVGLVYSEVLGGFGYHAWPEVHIGGWIPLDPTLGQPVADATHIKLLNGGIDKWGMLVGYMGRIEIEVLETEGTVETASEMPDDGDVVQ